MSGGEQLFWISAVSLGGGFWWTVCILQIPGGDKAHRRQNVQDQKLGRRKQRDHRPVGDGDMTGPSCLIATDSNNIEGLGFHSIKLSKM